MHVFNIGVMLKYCLCVSTLLFGLTYCQTASSSCQDVDTHSCQVFYSTKPDICNETTFSQTMCKRFCGNCPLECYSCPTAVRNSADCTTTSNCGPNSQCLLKTFLAQDGHHEFIMACERSDICDSLTSGFGKRGYISRRDLTLSCCDTHLCNVPETTSTAITTTFNPQATTTLTPSLVTKPPTADACYKDIVFVLDASGSVGATNFKTMLSFVGQIISHINIGQNAAHVALMTFDSRTYIQWKLNAYDTQNETIDALSHVRYTSGTTHTAEALAMVRTDLLTSAGGDRPLADNVVIVVTDGQSNNGALTKAEARQLHVISNDVVAIGVGSGTHQEELVAIATGPNHLFNLQDFHGLHPIVLNVTNIICH